MAFSVWCSEIVCIGIRDSLITRALHLTSEFIVRKYWSVPGFGKCNPHSSSHIVAGFLILRQRVVENLSPVLP